MTIVFWIGREMRGLPRMFRVVVAIKLGGRMTLVAGEQGDLEVAGRTAYRFWRKKGQEYLCFVCDNDRCTCGAD